MPEVRASPFFRPTQKPDFTSTPGGTRHLRKKTTKEEEHKSTLLGCAANLINAIVGSGIVGLPFAIQQAGFCAGVGLVILCAFLTEKSLRLLIETAKHAHVPSYETVAEAAFGRFGFLFVALNMFIMAYGAMLSYLMILKDTFALVLGVSPDNFPMKRAILFLVSISIIVPLSCQRDMADLAKTSRLNVSFDLIMVLIVVYLSNVPEAWKTFDWQASVIHYDTIFVGLGVLSFAFVCQHSAFIIAGSLDKPTKARWSTVTKMALCFASTLAILCGVSGYVGFQERTQGNILNSLEEGDPLANVARFLLGTTMLFVYPLESFVARHVCVVLFFEGRSAHEGDDTSVLNRRDRRITLTIVLYLLAVIPAALFENVGTVLAACGAVGGSCLSYIGPGAVYLGIHGARFLEMAQACFGKVDPPALATSAMDEESAPILYNEPVSAHLRRNDPPVATESEPESSSSASSNSCCSVVIGTLKSILWYISFMPMWCHIASYGKVCMSGHVHELVLKSPHPIRIGNVRFARGKGLDSNQVIGTPIFGRTKSMPSNKESAAAGSTTTTTSSGQVLALPVKPALAPTPTAATSISTTGETSTSNDYQSINQQIGVLAKRKKQEEELALEDDPQQDLPGFLDFLIAILYVIFGVVAMVAGIGSIFMQQ